MPSGGGHRLYVKGRHLSYQRGKRNTNPSTSLLKLEGVDDSNAARFYLGKKVAFIYRAQREVRGTKIRVIWGKVTRPQQFWRSSSSVQEQPPSKVLRCISPGYALSIFDMNLSLVVKEL